MKNLKRVLSVLLVCLMVIGIASCGMPPGQKTPTVYPYVFVHGLNGYGDDLGVPLSYWGTTGGDLLPALEAEGFECYAPSVSTAGSAWDRACELYAQLTGTRVDYGAAHSAKYGHERYGKTYTQPLFEGFGTVDDDGNLRKVNIIAHSFGGATARVLAALLETGSETEKAATTEGELSGLFEGGKGHWIFSLTCLAAPHNGVSLLSMIDASSALSTAASMINSKTLGDIMDAVGINVGSMSLSEFLNAAKTQDTAYADLSISGAEKLNEITCLNPHTYYYSYPVDGTTNGKVTNDMSAPTRISGWIICRFTESAAGKDASWIPNDGLVNTISATAPFSELSETITDTADLQSKPGIWYIMPTVRGDHGSIIGLGRSLATTLPLYVEQMTRINEISLNP